MSKLYFVKTDVIFECESLLEKISLVSEDKERDWLFNKNTKVTENEINDLNNKYDTLYKLVENAKINAEGYYCKATWEDLQKLNEYANERSLMRVG